ncbi:Z-ring formation inhibitor MciZ [Paenibacillus sp. LMG 31456]|uniref:Z-ring formation inhibitor MciZ n=1 Tax=Paenibacillus foliorum TaxID=2654974 RepID=A0A972GWX9_9BACL|nr:Z-ring formation inhibitor MciZ [Paenibacillus foliorum]
MKTYMTEGQIRLVGRVWEIRRFLKLAQQRRTTDVSLLEFLSEQTGYANKKQSTDLLHLDGEAAYFPENSSMQPRPQPEHQQKTQDPNVIPFPLR